MVCGTTRNEGCPFMVPNMFLPFFYIKLLRKILSSSRPVRGYMYTQEPSPEYPKSNRGASIKYVVQPVEK